MIIVLFNCNYSWLPFFSNDNGLRYMYLYMYYTEIHVHCTFLWFCGCNMVYMLLHVHGLFLYMYMCFYRCHNNYGIRLQSSITRLTECLISLYDDV